MFTRLKQAVFAAVIAGTFVATTAAQAQLVAVPVRHHHHHLEARECRSHGGVWRHHSCHYPHHHHHDHPAIIH